MDEKGLDKIIWFPPKGLMEHGFTVASTARLVRLVGPIIVRNTQPYNMVMDHTK